MKEPQYLDTPSGRRIAYHKTQGDGPGLVFLGGFKSDMEGTKALFLEEWAHQTGRAFLRFDYSGHGQSSGAFTDGCIGDWAEDAAQVLDNLTEGPQILIGSSMGGWISLLLCKRVPARVAGLITIAGAPDFTEKYVNGGLSKAQLETVMSEGQVDLPSDYGEPYIITRHLLEDGRDNRVLNAPLTLNMPIRLLQGTDDTDVDMSVALGMLDHLEGEDIRLVALKGADHRFSSPDALQLIQDAILNVLGRL